MQCYDLGGPSTSASIRTSDDPANVFATLPPSLQAALEQLDAALSNMPPEEAAVHMRRCVASGLWDPSAGFGGDSESPTGDSDDVGFSASSPGRLSLQGENESAADSDAIQSETDSSRAEGESGPSAAPPAFFSTRPLVVREGWELDSAMCSERITPDTTVVVLQTKDLPDGTRRARVAKEGSLVPQGWVSWVTANGSIGLVPKQGSVHLNLPPPEKVEGWSAASGADDASSSAPDSASARLGRNTYVPGRVTRAPSPRGGRTQLPDPRRAPPPPPVGAGGRSAPLAALSGALVARRGALGASFGAPSAPGGSRFGRSGSSFMGSSGAPMEAPIGAPVGLPTDLPYDAERLLSRFGQKGVKEFAVPLGEGWMQRAGRGKWTMVEEAKANKDGDGPVMQIENPEPSFYLLTYDQNPNAHVTKGGAYQIEANVRCLPGTTIKEQPYLAIVLNWQRGRSTVTAPCFTALVLTAASWRIDQYYEGQQTTLAEVHDATLKANNGMGTGWQRVLVEVRGDRVTVEVNKKKVFGSFVISPPPDANLAASRVVRASALTGPVGIATFRSRAQIKKFELAPLEGAEGEGGSAADGRYEGKPPYGQVMGGDPKLVDAIEGEMLEQSPNVAWDSIGGLADAKRLLNEAVVLPLLIPDYFAKASCRAPWKGVLLFGPPGTGKTLLARAVASLGKTAFFNISASSLVSKYHGESERLARTLFALARHHAPSIVFFDEIDALVSARGAAGEHEASRRLKSELLVQMDGIGGGGGTGSSCGGGVVVGNADALVMVLATSNRPWDLDEALRRRLERRIYVPLPDMPARREMLSIHLRGLRLDHGVDLTVLAERTRGYSGADLQLVCRDASMMPMRRAVEGKSPLEIVELQASASECLEVPRSASKCLEVPRSATDCLGVPDPCPDSSSRIPFVGRRAVSWRGR